MYFSNLIPRHLIFKSVRQILHLQGFDFGDGVRIMSLTSLIDKLMWCYEMSFDRNRLSSILVTLDAQNSGIYSRTSKILNNVGEPVSELVFYIKEESKWTK